MNQGIVIEVIAIGQKRTMRPNQNNPVHSPYVVVLGGNSVRRKSTPPPDVHPDSLTHHTPLPDKPEARVYGVLPPLKTMARDLRETPQLKNEEKKKWWNFRKTKTAQPTHTDQPTPHENLGDSAARETHVAPVGATHQATPSRVIDIPSEADRERQSPYRSRFMRGIAKKGYLTSKLAVQLPIHAKIGAMIALLVLVVGVPLASRMVTKPAPVTAGTVVALGTDALVAQVGKSIELPVGETPLVVLATADDIRRLNVPDAKPGNRILLYQQAGKIVVYDAEGDKVLGVVNRAQP